MTKTAYSMFCALCIAFAAAMQLVFSGFRADIAVSFSVFLCVVCCPLKYSIFCAVICPVISMMTAGNPAAVFLPAGMAKNLVFALLSGFLLGRVNTGRMFADLYLSLVPSICLGQTAAALISAVIFCGGRNAAILFVLEKLIAAIPETAFLLAAAPGALLLLKNLGMAENILPENRKTENSV